MAHSEKEKPLSTEAPEKKRTPKDYKPEVDHSKTISDYLHLVLERWFIGLLFAAAVTSFYVYKQKQIVPLYKTHALILFEIDSDNVVNISKVVQDGSRAPDLTLQNHLTHFRSQHFLQRVVETLTDDEKELVIKDYRDPETNAEPSVGAIIGGARHIARTSPQNFAIEFQHRNPQAAKFLADLFVDEYREFLLEKHRKGNDQAIRFLKAQSEELKLKVEQGELEAESYRQDNNLISLEDNENIVLERMKSISGALNSAKIELLGIRTIIEQLDQAIAENKPLVDLPFMGSIAGVERFRSELQELKMVEQNLSVKYLERHPKMMNNALAMELVEENLDLEINRAIMTFREQFSNQQKQVENLKNSLIEAEKESFELAQRKIEYNVLRRKVDNEREHFGNILNRKNETMIASQLLDTNLNVVDYAYVPGSPFIPNNKKIYTTAVVLAIISFISLPLALAFLNSKLKTRFDVEHFIGKEFLGEIHKVKKRKALNVDKIVLDNSDTKTCEFFRMLYSHVLLMNPQEGVKTFILTSMSPQEGKSFMVSNLAATFGKHEQRTVIIDCDLRQPSIHKGFDLDNKDGVLHWYNDPRSSLENLDRLGIHNLAPNLDVICAGGATRAATEVISSEKFSGLIDHLKREYDVVFIDTPPSAVFSDALLLGRHADYYVFVCKQKMHERRKIKSVIKRLDQTHANVLGIVFNQTNPSKRSSYGSYYYQYGYYGDYYQAAADAADAEERKRQMEEEAAIADAEEKAEQEDSGSKEQDTVKA